MWSRVGWKNRLPKDKNNAQDVLNRILGMLCIPSRHNVYNLHWTNGKSSNDWTFQEFKE